MTSTTESGTTILKTDTRGRVWTPKADREALLDLFEQGGMSGAAFARLHGLRYPTFAHWWKRRRERRERERQGPVALFQEVVLARSGGTRHEGLEIELPLGKRHAEHRLTGGVANQGQPLTACCPNGCLSPPFSSR